MARSSDSSARTLSAPPAMGRIRPPKEFFPTPAEIPDRPGEARRSGSGGESFPCPRNGEPLIIEEVLDG